MCDAPCWYECWQLLGRAGACRPGSGVSKHCLAALQVHWWRLVIDEAQMVGPLSAAGTMCERMTAVHRWCVTGEALLSRVPPSGWPAFLQ
jgi:hypothetical protein